MFGIGHCRKKIDKPAARVDDREGADIGQAGGLVAQFEIDIVTRQQAFAINVFCYEWRIVLDDARLHPLHRCEELLKLLGKNRCVACEAPLVYSSDAIVHIVQENGATARHNNRKQHSADDG
jgi:hypothetical protein